MRKKDILAQNISLFDSLEQSRINAKKLSEQLEQERKNINDANNEIEALHARIEELELRIECLLDQQKEPDPVESVEVIEENKFAEPVLDEAMQYGSSAIGKIVVESAKCVNLLFGRDDETKKALSNLIVCKCELAKTEILDICCSDSTLDSKKGMIDSVCNDATDYFTSVMAQE